MPPATTPPKDITLIKEKNSLKIWVKRKIKIGRIEALNHAFFFEFLKSKI